LRFSLFCGYCYCSGRILRESACFCGKRKIKISRRFQKYSPNSLFFTLDSAESIHSSGKNIFYINLIANLLVDGLVNYP